jgi:tRNA1(Val) A37 N6-methylase TrmN6
MLQQPETGYRVAMDTVLLAAAVPAQMKDHILDLGAGVGGAMLCLASRVTDLVITGLEIQPELVALGQNNIQRNSFADKLIIKVGDAREPITYEKYHHIMSNPPFHDQPRHDVSNNKSKSLAMSDEEGAIAQWMKSAYEALKENGSITLINRADRQEELLQLFHALDMSVEYRLLHSKVDALAKRVVVRAWKTKVLKPPKNATALIVHETDGQYTKEVQSVLRDAAALNFY